MAKFTWTLAILGAALIFIGCQGQTFQYSRGWTNGKRGGFYSPPPVPVSNSNGVGPAPPVFDAEGNAPGSIEDPSSPQGAFHVLSPESSQGRARFRDRDYPQLVRKLGSGANSSNNRKSPFWILGVEQESKSDY